MLPSLKKNTYLYPHVAALIAVTAWGASFIATKVLLNNGLSPVEIYIYRFLLAYLFTFLVCPKPFLSRNMRDELLFVLCGICGGSVYFIAENMAVTYTLVTNVSLLVTTSPLITIMLISLIYRSEKISKPFILGSLIALLGVGLVIFNSSLQLQVNPIGDLLALLASVCWAVYSIILRPLSSTYSSWFITRKTFFYGLITALPFYFMEENPVDISVLIQKDVIMNLVFLGMFASMLAYLLWGESVKCLGALKTGNYLYFCPIVTLILSAVILKEGISFIGITGCVMIIGGVILGDRLGSSHSKTRQEARR
ncbi:MAG: DMT family transporter [Paramuribaculum sp.]|nr:DMT family transporter [Paramuribaculum sp.]